MNKPPTDKEIIASIAQACSKSELRALQALGLHVLTAHFKDGQINLSPKQKTEMANLIENLHAAYKAAPNGWVSLLEERPAPSHTGELG